MNRREGAPVELAGLAHHAETVPEEYGPRLLWMGAALEPDADLFITTRSVSGLAPGSEPSVDEHVHDVSQTYLFLGEPGAFEIELSMDGVSRTLVSPSAAFIPAGRRHRLYIRQGTGTVVAILRRGDYS